MSTFIRLISSSIPTKGDDLLKQISTINQGRLSESLYFSSTSDFAIIPGTPFAYWVSKNIITIFRKEPLFQQENRKACYGLSTKDNFQFLRLSWEVKPQQINKIWFPLTKGGAFSRYFYDIHLVVDWENDGERLKAFASRRTEELFGSAGWSRWINNWNLYFHPGITWPLRTTSKLSVRALPAGCIFSDKGPAAFVDKDDNSELLALLAIMNSQPYLRLVELKLGAADMAARSYDVGLIQQTPIPSHLSDAKEELTALAFSAYELTRQPALNDETTHAFYFPSLLSISGNILAERLHFIAQIENQRQENLDSIQAVIDDLVTNLYDVPELGQISEEESFGEEGIITDDETLENEDDGEAIDNVINPGLRVGDLLMWCVGVSIGRWDVRYALDTSRLPELPGPFDPLPVYSPGMLTGSEGLPMRQDELPADYPLPIAWDGFLVDDPDHPHDIVSAVERTLKLFWPGRLEDVEHEACDILGVPDLRTWFRDPKGFFAYHTKRYSKSRRKAPIYWPLQSVKRNYAIWLYYPRLSSGSLYHAGREYADAKLKLETGRLVDWQRSLVTAGGSARKLQERKIASQEALVDELKAFVKAINAAALLELKPDLNDGVLLNIAPLHELVPWKEAGHVWVELLNGKYEWSSIGKQLRQKGLVKNKS